MSTELTSEQEMQVKEQLKEKEKQMWERFNDIMCNETSWLLKVMKEHFGEEAYQIFVKAAGEKTCQQWSKIADKAGDNSIETFIKRQWPPSGEQSEYTVEETELGFQFNVTKCLMCEMAKRYGITEQMFYIACAPDPFAAEGFNPNIGFKRTKTLMQGDGCCDHFYYYKDKNK